jgi:hypothetical protein
MTEMTVILLIKYNHRKCKQLQQVNTILRSFILMNNSSYIMNEETKNLSHNCLRTEKRHEYDQWKIENLYAHQE